MFPGLLRRLKAELPTQSQSKEEGPNDVYLIAMQRTRLRPHGSGITQLTCTRLSGEAPLCTGVRAHVLNGAPTCTKRTSASVEIPIIPNVWNDSAQDKKIGENRVEVYLVLGDTQSRAARQFQRGATLSAPELIGKLRADLDPNRGINFIERCDNLGIKQDPGAAMNFRNHFG